jgi:hypothetical protein
MPKITAFLTYDDPGGGDGEVIRLRLQELENHQRLSLRRNRSRARRLQNAAEPHR